MIQAKPPRYHQQIRVLRADGYAIAEQPLTDLTDLQKELKGKTGDKAAPVLADIVRKNQLNILDIGGIAIFKHIPAAEGQLKPSAVRLGSFVVRNNGMDRVSVLSPAEERLDANRLIRLHSNDDNEARIITATSLPMTDAERRGRAHPITEAVQMPNLDPEAPPRYLAVHEGLDTIIHASVIIEAYKRLDD